MLILSSELFGKFSHLYAINVITSCAVNWYQTYANSWATKIAYESTLIDIFYNLSAGELISIYLFVYSFNVNFCFVFWCLFYFWICCKIPDDNLFNLNANAGKLLDIHIFGEYKIIDAQEARKCAASLNLSKFFPTT